MYANWNPVCLPVDLEIFEAKSRIDLNKSGSFIHNAVFIFWEILKISACLFNDGNRFSSQGALVDQERSFQDFSVKGKFKVLIFLGVVQKYDISRNDFQRRNSGNLVFPQNVQLNLVVRHLMYFCVQFVCLKKIDGKGNNCRYDNDSYVVIILSDEPNDDTEDDE